MKAQVILCAVGASASGCHLLYDASGSEVRRDFVDTSAAAPYIVTTVKALDERDIRVEVVDARGQWQPATWSGSMFDAPAGEGGLRRVRVTQPVDTWLKQENVVEWQFTGPPAIFRATAALGPEKKPVAIAPRLVKGMLSPRLQGEEDYLYTTGQWTFTRQPNLNVEQSWREGGVSGVVNMSERFGELGPLSSIRGNQVLIGRWFNDQTGASSNVNAVRGYFTGSAEMEVDPVAGVAMEYSRADDPATTRCVNINHDASSDRRWINGQAGAVATTLPITSWSINAVPEPQIGGEAPMPLANGAATTAPNSSQPRTSLGLTVSVDNRFRGHELMLSTQSYQSYNQGKSTLTVGVSHFDLVRAGVGESCFESLNGPAPAYISEVRINQLGLDERGAAPVPIEKTEQPFRLSFEYSAPGELALVTVFAQATGGELVAVHSAASTEREVLLDSSHFEIGSVYIVVISSVHGAYQNNDFVSLNYPFAIATTASAPFTVIPPP